MRAEARCATRRARVRAQRALQIRYSCVSRGVLGRERRDSNPTSGLTGRSWRFRPERGEAGIPAVIRLFGPRVAGIGRRGRVLPAASYGMSVGCGVVRVAKREGICPGCHCRRKGSAKCPPPGVRWASHQSWSTNLRSPCRGAWTLACAAVARGRSCVCGGAAVGNGDVRVHGDWPPASTRHQPAPGLRRHDPKAAEQVDLEELHGVKCC